jgi:hypothetical protein
MPLFDRALKFPRNDKTLAQCGVSFVEVYVPEAAAHPRAPRQGLLTATIYIPPNAGTAMEMLAQAIQSGKLPPEQTVTTPVSYTALEMLKSRHGEIASARSAGKL